MTKNELRRLVRQRKACLSVEERQALSYQISQQVLESEWWVSARTILLYHALPDEVDTSLLLRSALSIEGELLNYSSDYQKVVLLPVVVGEELELRQYTGPDSMKEGAFGILEPVGEAFPVWRYPEVDLAIIPGMAFDGQGHRLGRGKGYYDRLLPRLTRCRKVGLCFDFQLVDDVPFEDYDVVMDGVVSGR